MGPNKSFILGVIQPILDGLKLFKKYKLKNINTYWVIFSLTVNLVIFISFLLWLLFPFYINYNKILTLIWFLFILGLLSFCMLLIGWSSLGKYSRLGGNRSLAQTLRFEIALTGVIIIPFILKNKLSIVVNSNYYLILIPILSLIVIILLIIEIQRAPLDLSEAERELVRGYNTEYSSLLFVLIFLAEYSNIIILLFIWLLLFIKINIMNLLVRIWLLIIVRSCYPRVRYDILIKFSWFKLAPIRLYIWIFIISIKL